MSINKKYKYTPNSQRKIILGKANQPRLPFMGKIWHCPVCVNLSGGYFEINGEFQLCFLESFWTFSINLIKFEEHFVYILEKCTIKCIFHNKLKTIAKTMYNTYQESRFLKLYTQPIMNASIYCCTISINACQPWIKQGDSNIETNLWSLKPISMYIFKVVYTKTF